MPEVLNWCFSCVGVFIYENGYTVVNVNCRIKRLRLVECSVTVRSCRYRRLCRQATYLPTSCYRTVVGFSYVLLLYSDVSVVVHCKAVPVTFESADLMYVQFILSAMVQEIPSTVDRCPRICDVPCFTIPGKSLRYQITKSAIQLYFEPVKSNLPTAIRYVLILFLYARRFSYLSLPLNFPAKILFKMFCFLICSICLVHRP